MQEEFEVITDIHKKQNKNNSETEKRQLIIIQETERKRIARDLHDTSLQNLTHLVHKVELCSMYIDKDTDRAKLELAIVKQNIKNITQEIRETIFDLRPMSFDDLGLKESFERLFYKMKSENKNIDFHFNIEEIVYNDDIILMTIFRVVKECCMNAVKHADANILNIDIRIENNICNIEIEDNGKGFDPEEIKSKQEKHFGLSVIEERVALLNGKMGIYSKTKQGTKIKISIPLG